MKINRYFFLITAIIIGVIILPSFFTPSNPAYKFPYKAAGLSEREAAVHLLNRFTYGPRPGDVESVLKTGIEAWFKQQLESQDPDKALNGMLASYDALNLSNTEVVNKYPQPNQAYKMALDDGFIKKDSIDKTDKKEYKQQVEAYMKLKGLRPQQELIRQFVNQKILRAANTNNQLQEVLTEFWFNHFNVTLSKNQCAEFIPAYERDVIRPNALGKFETLLLATAKSPAMLMYLDNSSSMAPNEDMEKSANPMVKKRKAAFARMQVADTSSQKNEMLKKLQKAKKTQGLNENYAREVMELHSDGVDGGYTQQDVTQAARVLTGWTVFPMGDRGYGSGVRKTLEKIGEENLRKRGFVHEGDFLFAANRHDVKEKVVLGRKFPAGGGYQEGVELLSMLAHHPSAAKFISRKIAVRFVSDNPPQALIDRMARTFSEKRGDIKEVLITMVASPEFWSKEALREKTKSPFELAISAVRSLNADVKAPYALYSWIGKMGQKIYHYQAPTGFPDRAQYWINTGALLNRMNFGLALASQRIPGVTVSLSALNQNREPESAEAALKIYSTLMMPERDLGATIKRLTPLLNEPGLVARVEEAATKASPKEPQMDEMMDGSSMQVTESNERARLPGKENKSARRNLRMESSFGNNSMLAQVVGVIIGSPEFQRK